GHEPLVEAPNQRRVVGLEGSTGIECVAVALQRVDAGVKAPRHLGRAGHQLERRMVLECCEAFETNWKRSPPADASNVAPDGVLDLVFTEQERAAVFDIPQVGR